MMLSIFNEQYFIDIDKVDKYVQIEQGKKEIPENEKNVDDPNGNTISIVKYELLKLMLEVVMDGHDSIDEKMGIKSTELSIPFKLAFNTLLNKKIITKY
ncbi:hypothetical protein OAA60_04365 [Porticoccaceae bacterium]|nr:hypothetical protein [bacterium]MDB4234966.1 hypothetical protein [bacterium]MDB4352645.1 hypothetical protein [Porticoccaceae bacterium]